MNDAQSIKGSMGLMDGRNHYMFSRSQYGNREFSVASNPYNGQEPPRTLVCGSDAAEKARLQKEFAASEAALKEAQEAHKVSSFFFLFFFNKKKKKAGKCCSS